MRLTICTASIFSGSINNLIIPISCTAPPISATQNSVTMNFFDTETILKGFTLQKFLVFKDHIWWTCHGKNNLIILLKNKVCLISNCKMQPITHVQCIHSCLLFMLCNWCCEYTLNRLSHELYFINEHVWNSYSPASGSFIICSMTRLINRSSCKIKHKTIQVV